MSEITENTKLLSQIWKAIKTLGTGILTTISGYLLSIKTAVESLDTKEGVTGAASDVDGTRAAQLRYIGEAIDTLTNRVEELEGGGVVLIGKPALGDFTTAYQSATAIDCTALPSSHSALIDEDIERIVHFNNTGAVVATYLRDEIGIVVTVPVAGTYRLTISGATAFAATDTFLVETNVSKASSSSSGVSSGGLSTWTLDDTDSFGQGKVTTGGTGLSTITVDTFYTTMVAKNILQIERWSSAGVWQATYTHRDSTITVSGATITVAGSVWGAGDTFKVKYDGVARTTDIGLNQQSVSVGNYPVLDSNDNPANAAVLDTTQYYNYVIDLMQKYHYFTVGMLLTLVGVSTAAIKFWSTNNPNATEPTTGAPNTDWRDITNDIFGVATFNYVVGTNDKTFICDTHITFQKIIISVNYVQGTTSALTLFVNLAN